MIHFKRAKVLASGVVSPMNKGILVTATAVSAAALTLVCLDPVGNTVNVTVNVPQGTSQFFPLYVRSWTGTGSPSVFELN